jgi:choice-of-anchor B domain-containing protein
MTRTLQRPISWGLVIALALALSAITPKPAFAHDSCAIAQPAATGALGAVVSAVSIFDPVMPDANDCPDKFEDVVSQATRDWQTPQLSEREEAQILSEQGSEGSARTYAPCQDGDSARFFDCENIDLLSHVSHAELGTEFLNDIWGWTDPEDGSDYALVGARNGTVFVDITDALQPRVLGIMESASFEGGSNWRDIKVYEDHAYVVSEHTNHGVQVFDLTRLRDWDGGYEQYDADERYMGHGSAHNIAINEDTGFAYSVGAGPMSDQLPYEVVVGDDSYLANGAAFGGEVADGLTGELVVVDDGSGTAEGCGELVDFPEGAIAIADRGTCPFGQKADTADAAGASGLIVANNAAGTIVMGGASEATIPVVMVSQADGAAIKEALPSDGTIQPSPNAALCGTGLHMIDINEPKNPTFAGCFDDHDYIHDTQCVIYEGPDVEHQGKEICFNSNGISYTVNPDFNYVSIVDVTDKDNPVSLSRMQYEGSVYSHQGWLTEDQSHFLHGDEGDETDLGVNTTTRVWDVSDLDAPEVVEVFENDTTSIDHNLYLKDDFAYAANYTSGLRVYDARNLDEGLSEVGYFDMYPENQDPTFEGGPWSNYPYFAQDDIVAVSSIDRGLFVLRPNLPDDEPDDGDLPACEQVEPVTFPDVPAGPPHGDNIGCVAGFGIAEGKADGTYDRSGDVRRDQMASFIARLLEVAGVDLPDDPDASWGDVPAGNPHELAIEQLTDLGIIEGRQGGGFDPAGEVTRAQMASFIIRALEAISGDELTAPPAPFTDTVGSVHAGNIDVAYDLGITEGRTATTYAPQDDVRRDQMGSFLARTLGVLAEDGVTLTPR